MRMTIHKSKIGKRPLQILLLLLVAGKGGIVSVYNYNTSAATFEAIRNFKVGDGGVQCRKLWPKYEAGPP